MQLRRGVLASAAIVGLALALAACEVPIADLGGTLSRAYGINASMTVVGASRTPSGASHAYKRLSNDTVVDLGTLPGGASSYAVEINDSGTAVGTSGSTTSDRAVTWNPAGQIFELPMSGWTWTQGRDISSNGTVVGTGSTTSGLIRGFVYDPVSNTTTVLPVPAGVDDVTASGINDVGQVVGSASFAPGTRHALRWDLAAGTVTDIKTLTGLNRANDINNAGAIVGEVETSPREYGDYPAVWFPGSQAVVITSQRGTALAIDEAGTVVGNLTQGHSTAFRWNSSTGIHEEPSGDTNETMAFDIGPAGASAGESNGHATLFFPDS